MPPPRGGRAWVDEHKKMSLRIPRERRRPTPVISIIGEESSPVEAVDDTKDSIPNRIVRGMRSLWATRLTEDIEDDPVKYIKTTLRELIVYSFFLIILCIITFGMAGPTMFFFNKVLNSLFLDSSFDENGLTFHNLATFNDFWNFAETSFLDGLYWESWYETKNVSDGNLGFVLHENKLLGVPRIRMLRVKNDSCTVAMEFEEAIKWCYNDYSEGLEDRENFGPHQSSNLTAWKYKTTKELDSSGHFGKLNYYGGGGYTQDLATTRRKSAAMIEEMKMNLWLQRGTRAIFMDFTVYNANINLFCFIRLMVEFSASGGAITSFDFRTVKLLRYVSSLDYFILFLECVFCLYILYYMVEEGLELKKHKLKYLKSFWNILDMAVIVIALCCIAFNIYRSIEVNRKLEALLENPEQFLDFEYLSFWQVNFNIAVAVMTFFAWAKIFKYLNFNKTMTQLSTTLSSCATDLAGFAVMFMIIFLAFAQLGHLIFGSLVADFKNFGSSIFTLFRIILGDFNFSELEQANRILGPAYFLIYVFIVFFILFNMFLAIINDTYSEVKADLSTKKNEFELLDFFKERVLKLILNMKARRQKIGMVKRALGEADQNKDKVIDFNEWRQDLKKRGYADKEIESVFKEYDKDGDNMLSEEEQNRMIKDLNAEEEELEGRLEVAQNKFRALHNEEPGDDDDTEVNNTKTVYLKREDFLELTQRVDNMELSIGSIVNKIDTVLMKLENMEKSKAKRREAMAKILEIVSRGDGISSKEKTRQMEKMMREEIQNWEKEYPSLK